MMERDGRPQGPSHPHPRRPRPYYTPIFVALCIIRDDGGPSYLSGIDRKGSPIRTNLRKEEFVQRRAKTSAEGVGSCPS